MVDDTDDTTQPAPMPAPGPTPEQIARAEKMEPLLELVQSDGFAAVSDKLREIHQSFMDEPLGYAHLFAVMDTMPRLKGWAEAQ